MKQTNRALVLSVVIVALGLTHLLGQDATEKPNVLFIAVDDLKPLIGAFGATHVHTPHMDRLATRGMIFENNHCQQAICGPSRASLMTGLRPDTTKVWDLRIPMRSIIPDVVTLPQQFITATRPPPPARSTTADAWTMVMVGSAKTLLPGAARPGKWAAHATHCSGAKTT